MQTIQPQMPHSSPNKLISNYNDNHFNANHNQTNSYLTNLPSFDLLRNSCYDLDCTDQSPSSSLSGKLIAIQNTHILFFNF